MPYRISRRTFGQMAGSLAAAAALPFRSPAANAAPAAPTAAKGRRSFPVGFLWGSATASYQVEGAVSEDGRGKTIWDTFSHTAGKTHNGDTGDVSTDSYHRYAEDIALMKDLGLKTCRFSVAWSRIFPDGQGQPNSKGIDHYRRFCEGLHAAGIEPWCTLYHWDLPQVLEDKGGWQNRDTARLFADYAGFTAGKLQDVCSHFMTMNEISTFIDLGYGNGIHAPGLILSKGKLAQARHYAVLGHGLGVQAIRTAAPHAKVGSAENLQAIVPVFDAPAHVEAARRATVEENAGYLNVMRTGRYTDQYLKALGSDAPKFTPEEMKVIGAPLDFQGLNIYTATYARAANNAKGYEIVPNPASYPHMESPWLTIGPDALYWSPRLANECWNLKEIYITENGCSAADPVAADGHIYDTDRVMYLRNYLTHLQRATSEGVPVRGYFLWSLLDNYEWADGYDKRFGITYVDFKTQKRTPKLSSEFYKNVIATNAL
jgi:beta-glucosidase